MIYLIIPSEKDSARYEENHFGYDKKIQIKGYKSIKEQEVELSDMNILIGGNGIGKSNFISLFTLIRNLYDRNLSNYVIRKGGADKILYRGRKVTQNILFDFYFGDKEGISNNQFIVNLQEADDNLIIQNLSTAFFNGKWHSHNYESNIRESNFRNINSGQAYWVNDLLKEFEVFHFHDTGDLSPMKKECVIDDNRELRNDGSNLAAFLYYLKMKHPRYFRMIEMTVASIAPFFDSFVLEPNRLNENIIKLQWKEKGVDFPFYATQLSDGTLRFIALATLLMQPKPPKIIIIDEPELGLHPVAINKLAGLMRKASTKSQLIISTQSVNLVDNFEPKDIVVVEREEGASVFKRLNQEDLSQWIHQFSLGEIWQNNIFGGQPLKR